MAQPTYDRETNSYQRPAATDTGGAPSHDAPGHDAPPAHQEPRHDAPAHHDAPVHQEPSHDAPAPAQDAPAHRT